MGAYWMIGALQALYEAGLDPRGAEVIVGTSAGAVLGGLLACGRVPWALGHDRRPVFDIGHPSPVDGVRRRDLRAPLRLLRSGLLPPFGVPISALVGGMLPAGRFQTDHVERLLRGAVHAAEAPLHRGLKIVASDRATARRAVFTASPADRLPLAVAASCAVPAWFAPVRIGGATYIDGGVHSCFNMDLATGGRPAPVLVLSAMSGPVPLSFGPSWLGMRVVRTAIGRQLAREMAAARRRGVVVEALEPGPDENLAMGVNLMAADDTEFAYRIGLMRVSKRLGSRRWQELLGLLGAREAVA